MAVIKLEARKVVVSEAGVTKVLSAPCGVSYQEDAERWTASVLSDTAGWTSKSFSIKKHGAIEAFEMAVEARENSMEMLFTRRLLPRIRRAYEIREINGLFLVRDPIEKCYRKFTTLKFAAEFNNKCIAAWKSLYKFNKDLMIKVDLEGSYKPKKILDSFTREFQRHAKEVGL